MKKLDFWIVCLCIGTVAICFFAPEWALANFGGFESRVNGLTRSIITVVLPALSILGLIYASILAVTGDAAARGRITMVVVCSVIGFLAPLIIKWLQSASGF